MRVSAGLFLCLLLVVSCLQAQRIQYGSIKGTVIDSASRQPLEAATVSVFSGSDSSLINYCLTNRKGEFLVKDIPVSTTCWYMISYNGLKTVVQNFKIPGVEKELSVGAIPLGKLYASLEEVTVRGQKPPVMIKRDTVEFNAPSFKTAPNAVVEDILKQLPGVEIDKDGNITINGKKVSKITIDGKDFFGGDFKIASKNLPTDIIDKIQVVDNKSREALFNKSTDGNEDKAINLTLKKDRRKGWFGRMTAGYGSDKRYESGGNVNFFNGSTQVNIISTANNTNKANFSGSDFNINNAQSSFQGGGSGITDSKAAGINFSNDINKQIKLTGSYFYNNGDNRNTTRLQRKNILPDTTFYYDADNNSTSTNDSHRFNVDVDYKPDTLSNLHLNSSYTISQSKSGSGNTAISSGTGGELINTSENTLSGTAYSTNMATDLFFGHRFKKQGRTITLGMNYNYSNQVSHNTNIGGDVFYLANGTHTTDSINQQNRSDNNNNAVSLSATYAEPVFKNLNILLRYDRLTTDIDSITGEYDREDSAFTNAFQSSAISHNPGVTMVYTKNKFRSTMGAAIQWLTQQSTSVDGVNTQLVQRYTNFFPSASIGYRFSKTGNINIYYNGRSQQPSVQQLQPIPDNSNPLYVRLGNPGLQPSFFHNINFNMQQSDGKTYWFAGTNFNTTRHQIVYETTYDTLGRQISIPVNVNGNYGISGNINYSRSWKKKDWQLRFSLGGGDNFNRNISFINSVTTITRTNSTWEQVAFSFTYKDWLTVMPSFNIRNNNTRYSNESLQNVQFNTKMFGADVFWNWPRRLIIENNLRYNYNSQAAPGIRKSTTMWNAAVNYYIFKNREGLLRLSVFDLLKQNAGIYLATTQFYVENTQVQTLQQYIMLSFTYNIKSFVKGK